MRQILTRALAGVAALAAAAAPVLAAPPVTTFTLDNGMEVVVIEDHRAPVVTHMVWYRVGAADEPWGRSGIAHFFEHLMFKGTDDLEPREFNRIVAENGGEGNAFTSQDYTGYFQRVAADRLGLMMELEAERMRDLILNDEVVATERAVILEERNQRTDNDPAARFREQMRTAIFMNHPYRMPVIGWRHEIEALSTDDARAFYERYYAPDNAILVVAGDVTPEEVRTLAEQHFGLLSPSGQPPGPRPQEPPQLAARRVTMADPDVRQPYVLREYLVPEANPGELDTAAALSVLAQALGGGIDSMFAEALQLEQGKAIDTGAWYSGTSRDRTSFGIYGVPAPGVGLAEVEAALDAVIAELKESGPDAELLARVKRQMLASEIYALDDHAGMARRYGRALAVGLTVEDVQNWPAAIEAVTAAAVRDAAQDWLVPEHSVTGWLLTEEGRASSSAAAPGAAAPETASPSSIEPDSDAPETADEEAG